MTPRPSAPVAQLRPRRWCWGYELPWLPDLLAGPDGITLTGDPVREAFGRQIAFLRAVAAGAPLDTALQLRFTADPLSGRVRCHLLGAGADETSAALLGCIVATALPPEYPLEPVPALALPETLRAVDADKLDVGDVVEIRRSIDRLDPTISDPGGDDPVLVPWAWSPQAMLASLGLLRQQPVRTSLVIQIEPAPFLPATAMFLRDEIRRLIEDARDGEGQAGTMAAVRAYSDLLRQLPRAALRLRVLVAGVGGLVPGLAESLSTDLTRSFEAGRDLAAGAAEVLTPSTGAELDACATVLDELRSVPWGLPAHPVLASLVDLFPPLEANTAFRLPIAPQGGLAGVASRRLSSLDRGLDVLNGGDGPRVEFGVTPSGGRFGLSARDFNQHVLVAGLPGFGKSSTVQVLLRGLVLELGRPFLVIDPAKGDYRRLLADLAAAGQDVALHRLVPDQVGLNPLAVPDGVDPGVHSGRMTAAFDAALGLSEWFPLALVQLQRAMTRLYDQTRAGRPQPTMARLYRETGDVIARSGLSGEVRANLHGSLLGRLELLATGPTGRVLAGGPDAGVAWSTMLARPTVVELGAFAAPTERALLFALLIAGLVSYREAHPEADGLAHVTVLEEAHRVLRTSGARDAGVEVFVDAIAELRGAGEGFLVVDQTPSLLHPGVSKLTGTKIAHRLVDEDERRRVGSSMVLDGGQLDDLARLGAQRAITYTASGSAAVLVDVDRLVLAEDAPPVTPVSALTPEPLPEPLQCVGCPVMCRGRGGLRAYGALAAEASAVRTSADSLLLAAAKLTGSPAEAYCVSATYIARTWWTSPAGSRERLEQLQQTHRIQHRPARTQGAAT